MSDTQGTEQQDVGTQPQSENDRLLDNFMRDTDGQGRRETDGVPQQTPVGTEQGAGSGAQTTHTPNQGRGQTTTPQQSPGQGGPQPGQSAPVQHVPTATRTYGNLFLADGNGDIYNAQGQLIAK